LAKCFICGNEINESNKSVEHIILNSIGGKLKSSELICKQCNSSLGNECDSELCRELSFATNMLNIERDRNSPQPIDGIIEKTGEKIQVLPGGEACSL
jgi:hypothetical protein